MLEKLAMSTVNPTLPKQITIDWLMNEGEDEKEGNWGLEESLTYNERVIIWCEIQH